LEDLQRISSVLARSIRYLIQARVAMLALRDVRVLHSKWGFKKKEMQYVQDTKRKNYYDNNLRI
jgi:hypothetical protein